MLVLLIVVAPLLGVLVWFHWRANPQPGTRNDHRLTFLVVAQAFVLAIQIGFLALRWLQRLPQPYPDFVSGEIGFTNQNKAAEYYAIYTAILAFVLLLLLIAKFYAVVLDNAGPARRAAVSLSLYALIPSMILAGQTLRIPNVELLLALSACAILLSHATVAFTCVLVRRRIIDSGLFFATGAKIMLGTVMLALSDIGVAVALSRAKFTTYHVGTLSLAVAIVCVACTLLRNRLRPVSFKSILHLGFYLAQAAVPLLFTVFASPPVLLQSGAIGAFRYTPLLYVLVLALVALSLWDIYRRFRRSVSAGSARSVDVSPFVLLAILVYLHSLPLHWPSVSSDDYHAGEVYLPWWLLNTQGYLPYVDYQPSRGLMNYVPGFLSWLFYDNTASGVSMVATPEAALYVFIAFFSLRSVVGDLVAFLATSSLFLITTGPLTGLLVAVCSLAFLHHVAAQGMPIRTLWLWVGLSFLVPLFAIAEGSIFVIASLPVGIFTIVQAVRDPRARSSLALSVVLLVVGAGFLALITPAWRIGLAAAQYLLQQSSVNDVAHAVPWMYPDVISERVTSGSLWQFVRFSWLLLVVPIGLELMRSRRGSTTSAGTVHRWLLLIALLIMTVVVVPRAAGRVGADAFSRPGWASIAMVYCALPLILFRGETDPHRRLPLVLLTALIFGVLGDQATTLRTTSGMHRHVIREPSGLISGQDVGLSYIGSSVQMDPQRLKRKLQIKRVLDRLLDPDETYYDATNHSADYAFQGRPSPVIDPAFHNVPSLARQRIVLSQLEAARPPLVLLEAENMIYAGATLPMRAFWIYQYLLEDFTPFADEYGRVWMIRHGDEDRLLRTAYRVGTIEDQVSLLHRSLVRQNLAGWPASWGRSMESLESALEAPVDLLSPAGIHAAGGLRPAGKMSWIVEGSDPVLILDIPRELNHDMLYLKMAGNVRGGPLRVSWTNNLVPNFSATHSFTFNSGSSAYLIPLSAAPSWELAQEFYQLQIDLPDGVRQAVQFMELKLYRRIGP